jgi:ABC-type methionine transport system ATPase subunit
MQDNAYNENMSKTPILTLQSVTLDKDGKALLKDITLEVRQGESVIISGPSGAGKSSLLRMMNRLEDPSSGELFFKNQPIKQIDPTRLRQQIALVFQIPVLFPGTVAENFRMVTSIHSNTVTPPSLYADKLEQVGLPSAMLNQEASSLSVGEKQRFSIARALLNNPEILLLDEPTSALDPESSNLLLKTMGQLNREHGLTLLMVTHRTSHGEQIGSRLLRMEAGEITEDKALEGAENVY